jgi:hypothetical protein
MSEELDGFALPLVEVKKLNQNRQVVLTMPQ